MNETEPQSPAKPAKKVHSQRLNWYLLSAGVLTVAFGFAHAAWGEQGVIAEVQGSTLTQLVRTSTAISWHQLTVMLLLAGVALLIVSIGSRTNLTTFVAGFLLAVVLGDVAVFAYYAAQFPEILGSNAPQLVILAVLIVLLVLGLFTGRAKIPAEERADNRESSAETPS
ncbi:MAG: hypothetical protein HGA39_06655 [Coriobacteriia bacterium]|nr:hypothetical protein [Coriobacteriia bacterium]